VINGSISISQGLARLNDFPVQIGEINNTIAIKNNKVTIPPLHFRAYENKFSLSGEFILTGLLPDSIILDIKNEDKKVVYQDVLESEADLKLEISNLISSPHISGHLFLSNGTLHINNLLKLEEGMDFPLPQPLAAARSNGKDQLEIDIELLDSFKLKMVNAEIEVGGKIQLGGSLADPVPQGTITLKKGVFIYFDKRFSITDGLVTINGVNPYDIDLNARAYTNVQNVRININVLGSLANPQILLSSQPNLKETEIISLLAFNRNIQGLSEGEISQILSQEMVGVLLQNLQLNLFNLMERKLATGLGLEFIKISYNGESNGGSPFIFEDLHLADLTLEVGKNIGDDLFITYSTPLSFKGEKSLGMDFQLSPEFTFTTQFDTDFLKKQDYKIRFGLEIRF
ncbi:MAG TPA: translocation/assembly module TamB domain-containing protein, partial [Atribacterota bacterium]|nr:translocation/assembly module TamB domain-containing protein [Atribacterota bacterium]